MTFWRLISVALLCGGFTPLWAQQCPVMPTPSIDKFRPPLEVCIPEAAQADIVYFNDFSWKSFVAMVWPSAQKGRGVPDESLKELEYKPDGALVFETLKARWEVAGLTLEEWDKYPRATPCKNSKVKDGDLVLGEWDKFGGLLQPDLQVELVGPLVAQNGTYVRYATGINSVLYQAYKKWSESQNEKTNRVRTKFTAPVGSTAVKSAWVTLDKVDTRYSAQYHTRKAWVVNAKDADKCEEKLVALLALHVVTKTESRPQWVWSTFQNVANQPLLQAAIEPGSWFALNSGQSTFMEDTNPLAGQLVGKPLPDTPQPFDVLRRSKPENVTSGANQAYRKVLTKAGLVWGNYELVMTQWPASRSPDPELSGEFKYTIPGVNYEDGNELPTTSVSNPAMETFTQMQIAQGCMNCHTIVQGHTDFVWTFFGNLGQQPAVAKAELGQLLARLKSLLTLKK